MKNYFASIWFVITLGGIISSILMLKNPSEVGSAVLFGFSLPRFILFAIGLLLLAASGRVFYLAVIRPKSVENQVDRWLGMVGGNSIFIALGMGTAGFLQSMGLILLINHPFFASRLEMLQVVLAHSQSMIAWIGFSSLLSTIWLFIRSHDKISINWPLGKWYYSGTLLTILLVSLIAAYVLGIIFSIFTFYRLIVGYYSLLVALVIILLINWCRLAIKHYQTPRWSQLQIFPRIIIIFLMIFMVYQVTALIVGRVDTPSHSYLDKLAYAFLDGKLYLENPTTTGDLTLYQGKWYVAFPPLAAIMMVPLAFVFGNFGIQTVTFTIFFGAVNTALVYEMLRVLSQRGWTKLSDKDNYWLVLLFALGTIHWYSSIVGKVWYINRIVALTFMLLAAILALHRKSPWLVGLAAGLSILARPNMIFIWPFFLGIYWQGLVDDGKYKLSSVVSWSMTTAVPISLGVAGLLFYNWIRFDNIFDFGYATMNVGTNSAVIEKYGQFNLAFIPRNLYYMWLSLPLISKTCANKLIPNVQGLSLILTTPPIVYIFKAFNKSPWVIGAWGAFAIQVALLLTHTGSAWEFGYRFFMDFIIPVMALIAVGAGTRVSWILKTLILIGVLVNLWGVIWYFGFWCPA